MNIRNILTAAAALAVVGAAIPDTGLARGRMQKRLAPQTESLPAKAPTQSIAYGQDAKQVVDFWRADANKTAPLIIFVHGGGWQRGSKESAAKSWKVPHYLGEGYSFASIGYRLVPDASIEEQAGDIASAIKALLSRSRELGIDTSKVVLMGHSAGAHLVALVGTDPRYLEGAGLSLASLQGVIPIDGAAYDVPRQMKEGPQMMQATYQTVFGGNETRQRTVSPTYQADAPNVSRFLVLHIQRPDGIAQSNALAAALKKGGTEVEILSVPGQGLQGHAEINRRMGDPSYAPTSVVDLWLKNLLSR